MSVNPTGIGLYSLDEGIQSTVHDASGSAFDIRVYDDIGVVMRSTPQVLIIDLLQSGAEGGYTLCKRIRQEVTWVDIPLFAITRDTSRSVSLALTAGFDDCLFLPMNQILFKHRMRQALKQYDVNRSARRYRSFVSHTQDAMIVVNPGEYGGDIKVWNAAAEQIYGWSADETVSQSLHEFIPTTYLTDQAEAQARQQIIDEHFWKGEVVQPHKDKTSLRIHASVSAVTDDTGQIIEYVGLNRDITVIHESEVALKQSEERLSSILAAIPELVLVLDREGIYRWIATEQHPILLLPAEKLLNHRLDEFFDKKQVDMFLSCIHQVVDTGTTVEMEYTLNLKGHLRWLQATVVKLDAERVVWVAYDISERKASEKALQESANSYRHLFESANDAIFLVDVQTGQISEANRQACRLLGYTIDELIGMAIEDVEVSTDDNYNDTLTATMGNTNRLIFEQQYRRKDGKIITVESSSRITRYLGKMGILSFARDITVRKRAEAAEHEQRLLAEALRDTAAAFNSTLEHDEVLDLILEYVNHVVMSEASEIMLIDEGYVTIRRHRGYIAPDVTLDDLKQLRFRADLTQNMKWMIEHQQSLYIPDIAAYEGWVSQREAEWIQSMLSAPIIIKGEVTGFINLLSSEPGAFDRTHFDRLQAFANQAAIAIHNAALFESTQQFAIEKEREVMQRTAALEDANQSLKEQMLERRQIEEALEDERNLLRTLIDNLPDHIYVKDWQSRFILANQALVEFLGLPHLDALLGKTDIDLGMPENAVELYEQEQTIVLSGDLLLNVEAIRESATGNTTWLLTSKMPLRDVGGDIIGLVGINRDITAIRLAEESLENERNLLRTLIDTIPDLIYIKDRESRFLLANQATMDLLGAS
ncbi:MAG: PAS domain S-box protein, partial [Aggregatilineales bacterium]